LDTLDGGNKPNHLVQQRNLVSKSEVWRIDNRWLWLWCFWFGEFNFSTVHHLHNLLDVKVTHILRGTL
jgi:hypothetical protein